ncbi:hypothetical protein AKO1_001601 [Acrasis kona]|uniref:Kinetochore protein Sos7 coiled-coil domain-containing protein n=1 Tax=Acrasis kona TaxID=1008807 RepID=A0AAW2ZBS0_9EUKA
MQTVESNTTSFDENSLNFIKLKSDPSRYEEKDVEYECAKQHYSKLKFGLCELDAKRLFLDYINDLGTSIEFPTDQQLKELEEKVISMKKELRNQRQKNSELKQEFLTKTEEVMKSYDDVLIKRRLYEEKWDEDEDIPDPKSPVLDPIAEETTKGDFEILPRLVMKLKGVEILECVPTSTGTAYKLRISVDIDQDKPVLIDTSVEFEKNANGTKISSISLQGEYGDIIEYTLEASNLDYFINEVKERTRSFYGLYL